MVDLPDGVVTFLFTDVEGSTGAMMEALRLHDEAIESAVEKHNGISVKPRGEGDSRFIVFSPPLMLLPAPTGSSADCWRPSGPRPSLCGCELLFTPASPSSNRGDYYGSAVNRAA